MSFDAIYIRWQFRWPMRFTSLGNTVDSSATVYRESDLGGLEICQRQLAERTGARGYIIVTERFVFGRFNCVVGRFRSIIIKKYFMHTSNCRKKEVRSVVLYASTIGRAAYYIIKDVIEQLRETRMNWRRMAAFLLYLTKHFIEE